MKKTLSMFSWENVLSDPVYISKTYMIVDNMCKKCNIHNMAYLCGHCPISIHFHHWNFKCITPQIQIYTKTLKCLKEVDMFILYLC